MHDAITEHLDLWTSALLVKSTAGRGSNGKLEAYGIKKLRELILELAVRGRLVPQDPNDEPASDLLSRTLAEKKRLIKEKVIRATKPPVVPVDQPGRQLPVGWVWTNLYEIGEISPRNQAEDDCDASFVPMQSIPDAYGIPVQNEVRKWGGIKAGFTHFQENDVVLAKITPCFQNGKSAVMRGLKNGFGAGTTELHVYRSVNGCAVPEYVLIYLKSPRFISDGIPKMTGTAGQKRITRDYFAGNHFPLPPLAEQHRIVAKVDELMALCDRLEQQQSDSIEAHQTLVETLLGTLTRAASHEEFAEAWIRIAEHFDTLFTTEHSIDQLKQTILQLAVMGKLVPQDLNDEPARTLLQKRCAEPKEDELLFRLPAKWEWLRLGDMGEILGGGTPSKSNTKYWNGDIPWVSPKDMKVDCISESIDSISEMAVSASAVKLVPAGSLLMVVRGMILAHSFPVAIARVPVTINQDMKAVVIDGPDKDYVLLTVKALKNDFVGMVERSTHGTCKLVSDKLLAKLLPIPPLAEQHRIVAKVDELMAMCDALNARLADAQTTQVHLADAVVEQAVA